MAVAPDGRVRARLVDEGIVFRHRSIGIDAMDLAQPIVISQVLRVVHRTALPSVMKRCRAYPKGSGIHNALCLSYRALPESGRPPADPQEKLTEQAVPIYRFRYVCSAL
jgi:hypothetical protein